MTDVLTQADIDQEIAAEHAAYGKRVADGAPVEHHPRRDYAPYRSSVLRHPRRPPVAIDAAKDPELVELSSPAFGERDITAVDNDLTRQHTGEPVGERITVSGRLLDRDGHPLRGQLVEIWQANSAGRYAHQREQHDAPLDPNFTGVGRTLTDDAARLRLVATYDHSLSVPEFSMGYHWDIVLDGPQATWIEEGR